MSTPTSLYGLQRLVARYRDSHPDTLRMHPLIQYALLRDPEAFQRAPDLTAPCRLAGCLLIVDDSLPRGGWQLLHGDEQLDAGTAYVDL